jgi:hypothetical protein
MTRSPRPSLRDVAIVLAAVVAGVGLARPSGPASSDLDAFMQKVLARRDENWKKLQQYILDEREQIDVRGPANVPIWGERRDFAWFIEDGYFVRSPVAVNGVTISDAERRQAEARYLQQVKARDARDAARETPDVSGAAAHASAASGPADLENFIRERREPEFVESAYFLRFKFERGTYALVGHETFDGRDVLRIEYYPSRLFSHEQDAQRKRQAESKTNREKDFDAMLERMMNDVSLVTLWVDPASSQIVKYTFDNVSLDFLPAAWLVRLSGLRASMTMSQPFPDVWLPRDVDMSCRATLAVGAFDVRYHLDYHDYRQATTSGRIIRDPPGGARR